MNHTTYLENLYFTFSFELKFEVSMMNQTYEIGLKAAPALAVTGILVIFKH